jgi:hypothetical protein
VPHLVTTLTAAGSVYATMRAYVGARARHTAVIALSDLKEKELVCQFEYPLLPLLGAAFYEVTHLISCSLVP